jgi:hypothetical protein
MTPDQVLEDLEIQSSFDKPLDSKWFNEKYGIDKRTLTYILEEIRDQRTDILIGSCTRGYYVIRNVKEAEYYQHFIRDRALKVLQRYNQEKKVIRKLFYDKPEQLRMEM